MFSLLVFTFLHSVESSREGGGAGGVIESHLKFPLVDIPIGKRLFQNVQER